MADSHLEYIKEIEDAYEMLNKLEAIFSKKGTCSKFYLLKELINLKYIYSTDLQEHFTKCDRIFRELTNLGSNFDESDMSCFLLLSKSQEYENIVTAIRTLSEKDLKLEFVKNKLLEFNINKNSAKNVKSVVPASSFSATQKQIKCFKCGKMGHVKSVCGIKCNICNKLGHKAKHCYQNKNKSHLTNNRANYAEENSDGVNISSAEKESVAFCSIHCKCSSNQSMTEWYADSGATHHYISDEKVLVNKRMFSEPKQIQLAEEGKFMEATCVGDIEVVSEIESREGNKQVPIIIKNVLCVPGLKVNLLSISTIEKAGFEIVCFNGKIVIKKNEYIYAEGIRFNNLYKIIFKHCKDEYANLTNLAVNNKNK